MKHVEPRKREPGPCKCGRGDKRPGQGDCKACHSEAQVRYRARLLEARDLVRRARMQAIAERIGQR